VSPLSLVIAGILTNVFEQLSAWNPFGRRRFSDGPTARPWFRVSAGIVDRVFVRKRFEIGPGDALGQVELRRGWIRSYDPLLLVEANRIHNQGVAFPLADGVAEICRPKVIPCGMRTPIGIDHAPRMGTGNAENKDALQFRNVDDLKTRRVEHCRAGPRLAADEWRIEIGLGRAVIVERFGPRLERHVC